MQKVCNLTAVSYTHLDVYKRQVQRGHRDIPDEGGSGQRRSEYTKLATTWKFLTDSSQINKQHIPNNTLTPTLYPPTEKITREARYKTRAVVKSPSVRLENVEGLENETPAL